MACAGSWDRPRRVVAKVEWHLFEPFPRWWKGLKGTARLLLAVSWWVGMGFCILGIWRIVVRRDGVGWVYIAYVLITLGFLAIFSGNVGTLIRHRDTASPILLMIAAVGVSTLMERWTSRQAS